MTRHRPDRRSVLARGAALLGVSLLAGCDRLAGMSWFRRTLDTDEDATLFVQRLLLSNARLAPEFPESAISPTFKPNGSTDPSDKAYKRLAANHFADFRLEVAGLVDTAASFTLAELRQMPSRTQITRHDCVEGWSCIGQWTGVPLSAVLQKVGLKPQARYVVFRCADTMEESGLDAGDGTEDAPEDDAGNPDAKTDAGDSEPADSAGGGHTGDAKQAKSANQPDAAGPKGASADAKTPDAQARDAKQTQPAGGKGAPDQADEPVKVEDSGKGPVRYYESIDLEDAFHPQTILAYEMNGQPLPVAHGAPLRLRTERQLGYKQAKYVMRLEVVHSLDGIGEGNGGYWEDQGYEWYAGI